MGKLYRIEELESQVLELESQVLAFDSQIYNLENDSRLADKLDDLKLVLKELDRDRRYVANFMGIWLVILSVALYFD